MPLTARSTVALFPLGRSVAVSFVVPFLIPVTVPSSVTLAIVGSSTL